MSGHSKWAQIKHKKALTDAKKGQLFSKLSREIALAAKEGGEPDTNAILSRAVERARSFGMPKENIERAISRSLKEGASADLRGFLYEVAAPDGVIILVEGITDNKNRALAEIKHLLAEYSLQLAEPGSMLWNFERVGVMEVKTADNQGRPSDALELAIIDAGARDLKSTDDGWIVETEFAALEAVRKALEERGVRVRTSEYDYNPRLRLGLKPEARESLEPLLEALADHDAVQKVYTNLKEG